MSTTLEPEAPPTPGEDPTGPAPAGPAPVPPQEPAEPDDRQTAAARGLGPSVTASFRDMLSLDDLVRAKRRGEAPTAGPSPAAAPASSPAVARDATPATPTLDLTAWTETLRTLDASGSLMFDVPPGARAQTPDGEILDGLDMLAKQSYGLASYYMSKGPSLTSLYAGAIMGVIAYGSIKWRLIAAAKVAQQGGKPGGTEESSTGREAE